MARNEVKATFFDKHELAEFLAEQLNEGQLHGAEHVTAAELERAFEDFNQNKGYSTTGISVSPATRRFLDMIDIYGEQGRSRAIEPLVNAGAAAYLNGVEAGRAFADGVALDEREQRQVIGLLVAILSGVTKGLSQVMYEATEDEGD